MRIIAIRPGIATLLLLLSPAVVSFAQTVSTVYSFADTPDGGLPLYVQLVQGRDGNLYGTTGEGGSSDAGTVFGFDPVAEREVIVANFNNIDGDDPWSGVTLATDGYFYGTTFSGGQYKDFGVLFKVVPGGSLSVLYNFDADSSDNANPVSPPIEASDGNLYGSTTNYYATSTIYKLTPAGTVSTITYLPYEPIEFPLLQGSDGNLYGVANGGLYNCGAIIKLALSGSVLHTYSFPCSPGGNGPAGPLIEASDGNYYGVTDKGGKGSGGGYGTIFKMAPNGVISTIYNFENSAVHGGPGPVGLTQGTDGNFYGTTVAGGSYGGGSLFQFNPATKVYTQLYSFPIRGELGAEPYAPPTQHTNGKFYGTTEFGGAIGYGSLYSLDMGLGPFVTFVIAAGREGGSAEILGQGLIGTTSVTFNGTPATNFTVLSDTYMTAVVPSGATSGPVLVTTPSGTLTSNKSFRISQ
jgi:uncharacterized repeat protein (TIGR03803 family)